MFAFSSPTALTLIVAADQGLSWLSHLRENSASRAVLVFVAYKYLSIVGHVIVG